VQPKFEVNIVPQVAGIVVRCHPNFVNGGFFQAGEPLIVIDPRDYKLAVENAGSAVATAQVRLDQERAEAAVARQEWNQLHPNEEPTSPLVVREPQIRQAEALLQAATAQLAKANLDLERTTIAMPFPGRITQKSVDTGQYVTPGQSVAAVYSTEVVEIVIPLEDRELAWFEAPMGQSNGTTGIEATSEADVFAEFEGTRHAWKGRVVRTQGRIDPVSRMVKVVVEVNKPFEISEGRPPLVPGMFAEVAIRGKAVQKVYRVPRHAIHNGNQVWVANSDKLVIRPVEVLRFDNQDAYLSAGLNDGESVVTTPLDIVSDGMAIRVEATPAMETPIRSEVRP
jgi:RND family efflux transporter MFP subunit